MQRYQAKPFVVGAVQLNWKNWGAVCEMLGHVISPDNPARNSVLYNDKCGESEPFIELTLPTLRGPVVAKHGDWIIADHFEFYPCNPLEFEEKYGAVPLASKDEAALESEIQAKGLNAPRLTPALIDGQIAAEYCGRASDLFKGCPAVEGLETLTICVLVLKNGFTVIGESACVSPENYDAAIGNKVARANAREKIWALEGYTLRNALTARAAHGDRVEARQAD